MDFKPDFGTRRVWLTFIITFSLVILLFVGGLYTGVLMRNKDLIEQTMLTSAQAYFDSVVLTRNWNASFGGVWVEKKPGVETNKWLKNPEFKASDGRIFTKRNPAMMTREISQIAEKRGLFKFHITSLKPINPDNAPDNFEIKALTSFENGSKESWIKETIGNKIDFRYMAPLVTETSCLACHAEQGYKEGDIRGGISVRFDISETERQIQSYNVFIYIIGCITLVIMLGIFFWLIRRLSNKLKVAHERIAEMAITDELTGLYNRRYFFGRFNDEFACALRYKRSLAVIMIDIDHFKAINDHWGHQTGDQALQILADLLRTGCRRTDVLARYGGEEFVIMLPEPDAQSAAVLAEKLRVTVASARVTLDENVVGDAPGNELTPGLIDTTDPRTLRFTISIGVASLSYEELAALEQPTRLVGFADAALYRAKHSGRNRVISH